MGGWKQYIARDFFRSRWVANIIFGIRFSLVGPDDYCFGLVTWHLIKVAAVGLRGVQGNYWSFRNSLLKVNPAISQPRKPKNWVRYPRTSRLSQFACANSCR